MVDIGTRYLGLSLRSPFVASASPISETLGGVRELEDAGVGAMVLFSVFEEQITLAPETLHELMGKGGGSYAETVALLPSNPRAQKGPIEYLEYVRKAKDTVDTPIIASINGSPGGAWHSYARFLEQAGADAVELNLYHVPTDPEISAEALEQSYFQTVRQACEEIAIPLAVKLHPFFTSLPHAARRFHECGADALVLFNRFYQPDIDIEKLRARAQLNLSDSKELRLPLRWASILRGQTSAEIAVTGGVHTAEDALKVLSVGAQAAMICSVLLAQGVGHLKMLNQRLRIWLDAHGYSGVDDFRGAVTDDDARAVVQRAQYMRTLHGYDR